MSQVRNDDSPLRRPKVSVCVITYNQERYIGQCLQSLVDQQTDFGFEVIVGDDCSTDGTRTVVETFADRYPSVIRTIYQPANTGGSRNNLQVHAAALGDYVAHVDGDDYALPGKLQAQANALDRNPNCTAVWHLVDYFDDSGGYCSGGTADLSLFEGGKLDFALAARLGFIGVHSSLMYRRSARSVVDLDQRILDVYSTWDLLSKGGGVYLDAVLGRYRVNAPGSITVNSQRRIRGLAISHARYFALKFPEQRRNFFLWAICAAIVDAKNLHGSAFMLLRFALRQFSLVSPSQVLSNLRDQRRVQVRWRQRDRKAMGVR